MRRDNMPDFVFIGNDGKVVIAELKGFTHSNANRILSRESRQRQPNAYVKSMEHHGNSAGLVEQLSLFDLDEYPREPVKFAISHSATPTKIDWLLRILMSQNERESFIGDLEERKRAILQHEGRRAATRWFWQEVIHSFFSLAFDALKRVSGFERLFRRIGS